MKKIILLSILCCMLGVTVSGQDYWEIINTPSDIGIHSVAVNSNEDIFLGTGSGVYRSTDEGISWEFLGIENQIIYSLEINEIGYIYAGCNLGLSNYSIYRSIDNGQSWEGVYKGFYNVICIKSFSNGLIYATSGTGTYISVIRSIDYGDTWEEVIKFPSNTEYPYDFVIQNNDTVYIGTINFCGGGGVYRSVDGGDTWKHIGLTDNYVSSLALNSSGDLFAGTRGQQYTYRGGVFVLPAGQTEWINLNDDELVTSIVINSEDKIYIGCSTLDFYLGGVRCSLDNGQTWEDISYENMYDEDIEELILGPEEHLYALAYNSATPLYKSVNSTTTSLPNNKNEDSIIIYNYPNPFSDETTIYFSFPSNKSVEVKITIYNSIGEKIKDIVLPKHLVNEQSITFNSKGLPSGIYYYELSAGSVHKIQKMVLQK